MARNARGRRRREAPAKAPPPASRYQPPEGVPAYLLEGGGRGSGGHGSMVWLGAGLAALFAYFAVEALLASAAHPLHWAVAAAGAAVGAGAAGALGFLRRWLSE